MASIPPGGYRPKQQRRTGNALPKQAQRLIEQGRELVKEAKR